MPNCSILEHSLSHFLKEYRIPIVHIKNNRKLVGLNLSYHKIEDQFLDSIASIRVDVIAKLDQGGQKPMESDGGGCISDLA